MYLTATSRIHELTPEERAVYATLTPARLPEHVAIIMDGNGRWATQRGLPRTSGHIEGAKAVRTIVEAAARSDVKILTLYAFSSANWARPAAETAALMQLFGQYLFTETRRCVEQSSRLNVIGRRDRLSDGLLRSIAQCERMTAAGVEFVTAPRAEPYGRVAVFLDVAGNKWDLLGPA